MKLSRGALVLQSARSAAAQGRHAEAAEMLEQLCETGTQHSAYSRCCRSNLHRSSGRSTMIVAR